jgi:hypothetical protein
VTEFTSLASHPDNDMSTMGNPAKDDAPQPVRIIVRCVAYRSENQWQAFSLEYGLAAQADSFHTAREKLHSMIDNYLDDALEGEDQQHAKLLLARRATANVYFAYYLARSARIARKLRMTIDSAPKAFCISEPHPQHC